MGTLQSRVVLVAVALLVTRCVASPSQTMPGTGSMYPVHGWDVYFNWAVPLSPARSSRWMVDVTIEVGIDPGEDTHYYFSHFTL
jgi:hypothetical protein